MNWLAPLSINGSFLPLLHFPFSEYQNQINSKLGQPIWNWRALFALAPYQTITNLPLPPNIPILQFCCLRNPMNKTQNQRKQPKHIAKANLTHISLQALSTSITNSGSIWMGCGHECKNGEIGICWTHNSGCEKNYLYVGKNGLELSLNFKSMDKEIDNSSLPLVQNVVSFAMMNIESDLNLNLIAEKVEGSRYNKKRFPAVIMRKTAPKSTILVFKSGRMIIIGSESEADAEQAARKSIKDIQKSLSLKLKMVDFRVTNIVANADLGCRIDIGKLCEERNVVRNQNFPGVVYKQMEHVKSALIFASGKVVFTGAKTKDAIDNAFIELKKKMEKFRK